MSNQLVQLLFMEESITALILKNVASSSGREISDLECLVFGISLVGLVELHEN